MFVGDVFGFEVERTWEFNKTNPVRSIVLPHLLYGPPFYMLKWLCYVIDAEPCSLLNAYVLLILPRLVMALLSVCCDCLIYSLAEKLKASPKRVSLIFASSYVALVFYTRTLSNSIESFLFILLLHSVSDTINISNGNDRGKPLAVVRRKMLAHGAEGISAENYFIIALIIVVGTFNRPTFIVFAIVPYYYWLFSVVPMRYYVTHVAEKLFYSGMCGVFISAVYVVIESFYYGSCFFHLDPNFSGFTSFLRQLTITPLNFIRYNTNSENLAEHGLHSRFTHAAVNCPLLFGVLVLLAALEAQRLFKRIVLRRAVDVDSARLFLLQCFLLPLALLSIFPHQEPRFLIPLLAPLSILYADKVCSSCTLYVSWIVSNLLLATFFGAVHQGGLVPSLVYLQKSLTQTTSHDHVVFYHTYMPPRHLLAINSSVEAKSVSVYDLKGAPVSELKKLLSSISSSYDKSSTDTSVPRVLLVVPQTVAEEVCGQDTSWLAGKLLASFWPHVSMEDPPDWLSTAPASRSHSATSVTSADSQKSGLCVSQPASHMSWLASLPYLSQCSLNLYELTLMQ